MLSDTTPGPTLPTPTAPAPWSMPPATIRTRGLSPSSSAADGVRVPTVSPGWARSGSRLASMPTRSSISSHQVWPRMSKRSDVHGRRPRSRTGRSGAAAGGPPRGGTVALPRRRRARGGATRGSCTPTTSGTTEGTPVDVVDPPDPECRVDLARFGQGPVVQPHERRRKGASGGVHRNDRLALAGDGEGGDVVTARSARRQRTPDGRRDARQ